MVGSGMAPGMTEGWGIKANKVSAICLLTHHMEETPESQRTESAHAVLDTAHVLLGISAVETFCSCQ